MPDGREATSLRIVAGVDYVPAASWDRCAGQDNPFCRHAFLRAMEDSGSAAVASGWTPCHVLVEDSGGELLACAPVYAKAHSYGEYVFDWAWADAWQRAGGRYYPKLLCGIPFTPVTGPRLLVRPDCQGSGLEDALIDAIVSMADGARLSSAHVTFAGEDQAKLLAARGWLLRMGEQYHWTNEGYASFEDFLGALSSRKRKAIRKERERANSLEATIHTLSGDDIKSAHWDAFHRFYLATVDKKWANAYLTRDFFARLGDSMAESVVLIMAESDGRWVAGALNLIGGDTLYGRNWGAASDFPYLHFEMCYYRAIDYAIAHGIRRVEAGAQGEHKVSRGYLPVPTWSAHWIREAPFRRAVANFLEQERAAVAANIEELSKSGPYRQVE